MVGVRLPFGTAARWTYRDWKKVEFAGLPASAAKGEVIFEDPRSVEAKDGKFADWFAPYEVHVYRFGL